MSVLSLSCSVQCPARGNLPYFTTPVTHLFVILKRFTLVISNTKVTVAVKPAATTLNLLDLYSVIMAKLLC